MRCWGWELGIIQGIGTFLLLAPFIWGGGTYHRESVEPTHECMNSCMFLCSDVFFWTVPTFLSDTLGDLGSDLRTALHLSSLWGSQASVSWSWDCKTRWSNRTKIPTNLRVNISGIIKNLRSAGLCRVIFSFCVSFDAFFLCRGLLFEYSFGALNLLM